MMTSAPESSHPQTSPSGEPAALSFEVELAFRQEIESRSRQVALAPGHVLFREGDEPKYIYLLKKGDVIFTIVSLDQAVPCFAVGAGTLLGLSAVVTNHPYALSATASPDAEVLKIPADEFLRLIEGRTAFNLCILRLLAEETHKAHQALADLLAAS
jgi:CRP-like cAMP-binding protein